MSEIRFKYTWAIFHKKIVFLVQALLDLVHAGTSQFHHHLISKSFNRTKMLLTNNKRYHKWGSTYFLLEYYVTKPVLKCVDFNWLR